WGLLGADLAQTVSRTRIARLDDDAIAVVDAVAGDLFGELASRTRRDDLQREIHLDIRYVGQEHTMTITAPSEGGRVTAGAAELARLFEVGYARTYGSSMDEALEITTVRALVRLPREVRHTPPTSERRAAQEAHTEAWSFARDGMARFALVERDTLRPGD